MLHSFPCNSWCWWRDREWPTFTEFLFKENCKDEKVSSISVTRFGEILPTLAKVYYYFATFLELISIWQHLEPTLATFIICIGQIFIVVKAKYWKMNLTSVHTVVNRRMLLFYSSFQLLAFYRLKRHSVTNLIKTSAIVNYESRVVLTVKFPRLWL